MDAELKDRQTAGRRPSLCSIPLMNPQKSLTSDENMNTTDQHNVNRPSITIDPGGVLHYRRDVFVSEQHSSGQPHGSSRKIHLVSLDKSS